MFQFLTWILKPIPLHEGLQTEYENHFRALYFYYQVHCFPGSHQAHPTHYSYYGIVVYEYPRNVQFANIYFSDRPHIIGNYKRFITSSIKETCYISDNSVCNTSILLSLEGYVLSQTWLQ